MKRILVLFIAVVFCVQLVSCTKQREQSVKRTPLTVETSCFYSDSEKEILCDKAISVIEKTINQINGEHLSDEKLISIKKAIEEELFDALVAIPVYPNELNIILDSINSALNSSNVKDLSSVYTKGASLIGAERSGAFFFELLRLILSLSYEELLPTLENDIGKASFADICGVFSFLASIGTGFLPTEASFINNAELLMILKRQANYYAELKIESSQWVAAARLFNEILQIKGDDMYTSVLSALADNDFFVSSAAAIPEFIGLYKEFINSMAKDELELILENGSYTTEMLCAVISRSEEKFKEFTEALMTAASVDHTVGYNELKALGYEQKYLDYVDNMSHTREHDLFDAIKAYGDSPSISDYGELNTAIILYIYRISPALAFITEYKLAEVQ